MMILAVKQFNLFEKKNYRFLEQFNLFENNLILYFSPNHLKYDHIMIYRFWRCSFWSFFFLFLDIIAYLTRKSRLAGECFKSYVICVQSNNISHICVWTSSVVLFLSVLCKRGCVASSRWSSWSNYSSEGCWR